jgi:hypothetical protein
LFARRCRYCTVNVVEAVTPLKVAVIVVVPVEMPVATPAALMVAAAVLLDVHVAELVTMAVVLSEYVAVAVNCCVEPESTVALVGAIVMELTTLLLTVRVVLWVMPLSVAVIVVLPSATAVARPEAAIVAIAGLEEVQVAVVVMSRVVPSPKTPLAENCCVAAGLIEAFKGLIVNEATSLGLIKKPPQPTRITSRQKAVSR